MSNQENGTKVCWGKDTARHDRPGKPSIYGYSPSYVGAKAQKEPPTPVELKMFMKYGAYVATFITTILPRLLSNAAQTQHSPELLGPKVCSTITLVTIAFLFFLSQEKSLAKKIIGANPASLWLWFNFWLWVFNVNWGAGNANGR